MKSPHQGQLYATLFIALFLGVQIWLPLSYYVGDNHFDERFAWRMFSPTRMAQCKVTVTDHSDGQPKNIRLSKHLHIVWINLLKRARPAVIDAVASKLCGEAREVGRSPDIRIDLACGHPDSVTRGICQDTRDRNGDGVPDGYTRSNLCNDLEPGDC